MKLSPLFRAMPLFALTAIALVSALAACGSDSDDALPAGATAIPTLVTIATPTPGTDIGAGAAASGQEIFTARGCVACHSTGDNRIIGPGLAGIGDRAATRVAGQATDLYIEQAIRDPGAFVVDGFPNLMPTNFGDLTDSEIADLIAFLKSL